MRIHIFHCWHNIGTVTQKEVTQHGKFSNEINVMYHKYKCCKCPKIMYKSEAELEALAFAAEYG